jgi:DNA-binding PadR family transcriptional regulator
VVDGRPEERRRRLRRALLGARNEEAELVLQAVAALRGAIGRQSLEDLLTNRAEVRRGDHRGQPYYVVPKRLAGLGYLDAHREPGKTRERTVYTLTGKGLDALRQYPRTPVSFTPLKSDPLLRLLIADLVGEEATRESLAALREAAADLLERPEDGERTAQALPHRTKYLLLVTGFLRQLIELHVELVADVERELAPERAEAPPAG